MDFINVTLLAAQKRYFGASKTYIHIYMSDGTVPADKFQLAIDKCCPSAATNAMAADESKELALLVLEILICCDRYVDKS